MHSRKQYTLGKPTFQIARLTTSRLRFTATSPCLVCAEPTVSELDALTPQFKIGQEFIGVVCTKCIGPKAKAMLAEMRAAREKETA